MKFNSGYRLPPGAVKDFYGKCTKCGLCIKSCPTQALSANSENYPAFNGPCVFCMKCVRACPQKILKAFKRIGKAAINPLKCAAWDKKKGHCLVCWEWCPRGAVALSIKTPPDRDPRDFVAKPYINEKLCNGCSTCIAGCPHKAINLKSPL